MQQIKRCIHQVFRPTGPSYIHTPINKGDCKICTYDEENNKNCSGYYPITILVNKV